jgi:hypothetical protein
MKKFVPVFLATLSLSAYVWATTLNVRDLGAVGDGKADDTEAIQKAFLSDAAEVLIPAGTYRITKTLQFAKKAGPDRYPRDRHIRGEGSRTILMWDGEKGGTLLRAYGMGHCQFSSIWFWGQTQARRVKDTTDRAGILFLIEATGGIGNMINHFSFCQFTSADVCIQCGTSERFPTNSDISFEHINVQGVGTFFYTMNNQAVDFLFNFVFICDAKTVFHFERGGNLLVNNCQATETETVLRIDGGGRCCATYVLNNVRLEGNGGGQSRRYQLLKATDIKWEQAVVRFTGFNDIMWQWFKNPNETRNLPLCEIGPGVNVAFESSVFNGPVAALTGKEGKPASLVIRESTFGYLTPAEAISANPFGYFKTENCFNDHMVPYPDITKWAKLPAMDVPGNAEYKAVLPESMPSSEKAEEAHLKRTEAWVKQLEK